MRIGRWMVTLTAVALLVTRIATGAEEAAPPAAAPEPTTAKGWFAAGHERMEAGNLDGAVEAFTKAKEACRPTNKTDRAWAANNIGLCHIRASKWDEARAALEEATGLNDANGTAWNNLGTVYLQQKEYGKAAAAFESALKAKPDDAKFKANLTYAKSLSENGEGGGAKKEAAAPKAEEKKSEATADKPAEEKKP